MRNSSRTSRIQSRASSIYTHNAHTKSNLWPIVSHVCITAGNTMGHPYRTHFDTRVSMPSAGKAACETVSGSHADRSEGNSMADAHPHNSALTTRSHCPSSHTLSPMGGLMTVRANGDAVKQDVITGSRSLRTFGGATGLRHAERAITWCNPQLFLTSLSSVIFADATHVVPSKSPSCAP